MPSVAMRRGACVRGRGARPGSGSGHEAAARGEVTGALRARRRAWARGAPRSSTPALGGRRRSAVGPWRRARGGRPAASCPPHRSQHSAAAQRRQRGRFPGRRQRAASPGSAARPPPLPATGPRGPFPGLGSGAAHVCGGGGGSPGAQAASPFSADSWRRGRGLRRWPSAALSLCAWSREQGLSAAERARLRRGDPKREPHGEAKGQRPAVGAGALSKSRL